MRSDVLAALAAAVVLTACSDEKPSGPAPSRFAAVKKDPSAQTTKAAATFCDFQLPAGEGGKKLAAWPERPVPKQDGAATKGAWKWVNLWATWCHPCVEEMGLLVKWRDSLRKDGVAIDYEMWSMDDDEAALSAFITKNNMPGRVKWIRSVDDMGPALESLGLNKASAIPVHALVDADNNIRCVRAGSVHEEDYAAIKTILTGA